MVYFKVNKLLARVIKLAEMQYKSAIGCTRDCDKQVISLDDLDVCLGEIKCRVKEFEETLTEQKDLRDADNFKDEEPLTQAISKEQMDKRLKRMQL